MKRILIDLTGKRFGKLVVMERADTTANKQIRWRCLCDCGIETVVMGQSLRRGQTKSCGCSQALPKHGMYKSKEYKVWDAMVQRCTNTNHKNYHHYGGRGIDVCDRWLKFELFYEDMGDANGLSLDRIDNNKGYSKINCRWATKKMQSNNMRTNATLTIDGVTKTRYEWSEISGIPNENIRYRIRAGWDVKDAVFRPLKESK